MTEEAKTELTVEDVLKAVEQARAEENGELPADVKALLDKPLVMPPQSVKRPLYKLLMGGYYNFPKAKVRRFWHNGELITAEAHAALSWEERHESANRGNRRLK